MLQPALKAVIHQEAPSHFGQQSPITLNPDEVQNYAGLATRDELVGQQDKAGTPINLKMGLLRPSAALFLPPQQIRKPLFICDIYSIKRPYHK